MYVDSSAPGAPQSSDFHGSLPHDSSLENGNSNGPSVWLNSLEGCDAKLRDKWRARGASDDVIAEIILAKQQPSAAVEPDENTPRRCTDVGNAERFAAQHGADVRYCHLWKKWIVWDGRRWRIDDSGEIERRAKLTARSILAEAATIDDKRDRDDLVRWAVASEKRERLNAMIALAQSEQPIPIPVDSLDAEPWLLNCENGTLDLRNGELRPHQRQDFLTKLCPVEYPTEPGIDPDLWLGFLDDIFDGNAQLNGFLQRLLGARSHRWG